MKATNYSGMEDYNKASHSGTSITTSARSIHYVLTSMSFEDHCYEATTLILSDVTS